MGQLRHAYNVNEVTVVYRIKIIAFKRYGRPKSVLKNKKERKILYFSIKLLINQTSIKKPSASNLFKVLQLKIDVPKFHLDVALIDIKLQDINRSIEFNHLVSLKIDE